MSLYYITQLIKFGMWLCVPPWKGNSMSSLQSRISNLNFSILGVIATVELAVACSGCLWLTIALSWPSTQTPQWLFLCLRIHYLRKGVLWCWSAVLKGNLCQVMLGEDWMKKWPPKQSAPPPDISSSLTLPWVTLESMPVLQSMKVELCSQVQFKLSSGHMVRCIKM